ncbi:MAG: hypothetical protein PF961_21850 [Planctomycetota bacterium]|jgi:hypothetical protein|nr:hypothetical protein [Planctomycetota bacterium]
MRWIVSLVLVANCGLGAAELDLFGTGGRPDLLKNEIWLGAGASYRMWNMTNGAGDFNGLLDEVDWTLTESTFADGSLSWRWRPWLIQVEGGISAEEEDNSWDVSGKMVFVGEDPFWLDLAFGFSLAALRYNGELSSANGNGSARFDEQRFATGMYGQGGQLAGSGFETFLAHTSYPAVVGFRTDEPTNNYSTIDDDFETWRLGIGFNYDYREQLRADRRKYFGAYAGIWGEAAWLWTDIGGEAASEARQATGRDFIREPYYWDFRGGVEVGATLIRRNADRGDAGLHTSFGYRLWGQVIGVDSWSGGIAGENDLIQMWNQWIVSHGPFFEGGFVF